VRLPIDTHVLLWWNAQPDRIVSRLAASIKDEAIEIFVSAASVWEIAIKRAARRLGSDQPICPAIAAHGFSLLPITGAHAEHPGRLPRHHGDPFDRMLAAQAMLEGMLLGTPDPKLAPYGIAILGLSSGP
jgi:PIN domain nuclease of toxin-antitoxin system